MRTRSTEGAGVAYRRSATEAGSGVTNEDPLNDRRGLCLPTPNAARMAPAANAHVVP